MTVPTATAGLRARMRYYTHAIVAMNTSKGIIMRQGLWEALLPMRV